MPFWLLQGQKCLYRLYPSLPRRKSDLDVASPDKSILHLMPICLRHINCVHISFKGQQSVLDPETKRNGQPTRMVFMAGDINGICGEYTAE